MANWYNDKIKTAVSYRSNNIISNLELLYPGFAFFLVKLFIVASKSGLRVRIFETYRSQERQLTLYKQGKTKLKSNGMHHFGVAADVVFRDPKNNPIWSGDWKKLGQIGKGADLFWGGDWKDFVDSPHFQLIPVAGQQKIINLEYPPYESKIEEQLSMLIPLYNEVRVSNYSDQAIKKLMECHDKISMPVPTI